MKTKLFSARVSYLIVMAATTVSGADRYWISPVASNWNNTANWSSISGGASGVSVPGTGDIAYFDGGGAGTAQLNSDVQTDGLNISSAYPGDIALNGFIFTVSGASGTSLDGSSISNGNFIVNASSATVTITNFTFNSAVIITGSTFSAYGTIFNGTALLEKTGGDLSWAGNTFNATTTIINSGSGSLFLGGGAPDNFNADVTFTNRGGGFYTLTTAAPTLILTETYL